METFKTKKFIKTQGMLKHTSSDEERKSRRSFIIEDKKAAVPAFKVEKEAIKAHNELFETSIAKSLSRHKGVMFSDGIHQVEMIPCIKDKVVAFTGEDGKLLFQAFNGHDDLRYSLNEKGLKEEIIVSTKRDEYVYEFKLKLTNLETRLIDGEKVIFVDMESKAEVFKIAGLVMFDARGEESSSIVLNLDDDILKMTCNRLWLNDEIRVFPIVIDPQIETINTPYISLSCFDQSATSVSAVNGKFAAGRVSATQKNYLQLYVDGERILRIADGQEGKYTLSFSYAKGVIPATNAKRFKVSINNVLYENGLKFDGDGRYSLDITSFVMVEDTVPIKIELDETSGTTQEYFYAYDFSCEEEALRPSVRCETLEIGEAIETASVDKELSKDDAISVNLNDGNYLYKYNGPSIKENALKVAVDFFHTSLKRTNTEIKDAHMGGLRTNLHQYLIKSPTANELLGTKKALYIDGDHRSHELFERWFYEDTSGLKTFIAKSSVFLDDDGKLKTSLSGQLREVKYDVVSDDGLSLVSAASLFNYRDKATKKVASRTFRVQLNGSTQEVEETSPGVIRMPHFTHSPIDGTVLGGSIPIPTWHTKPTESYNATGSTVGAWNMWVYVSPINVEAASAGDSTASTYFRTHYYDLPLLKDETGFYVEIYSIKELANYGGAGSHAIMYKAESPTKVYLIEEVTYSYEQVDDLYQNDDLKSAREKIKQIEKYLSELSSNRTDIEKSIKAIDSQIALVNKESTRFQVQIKLSDIAYGSDTNSKCSANYRNETDAVSRADSLARLHEQRVSVLKQLGDVHTRIDEYQIMLENTLAEKERLIEAQQDGVNDLVIDKNGNALGFDYHGKLILIQDQFENKLEITYDEEKMISIKGKKEKIEFVYNEGSDQLAYVVDVKGRKIFFEYDETAKIKRISKEQKADSKKAVGLAFNAQANLLSINHFSGYMSEITYTSGKVSGLKQKSYIDYIIDKQIVHLDNSETPRPVIFDMTMQYVGRKTTLVEARNNMSTVYLFDAIGRVINVESADIIAVNRYIDNMQVLKASYDKRSQNALSFSGALNTSSTTISLALGSLATNGTRVKKDDSPNGMYTFLVNVGEPSGASRQLTLEAQVYQGATEVAKTKFAVRYDNPYSTILALPVYVPNDSVSTELRITIKSNLVLSSTWLSSPRLAKGEWEINEFNAEEHLVKKTSGAETLEFLDYVEDNATRIKTTNVYDEIRETLYEYDADGRLVYVKDGDGQIEETYYDERGQIIEKRSYLEESPSEVSVKKYRYDESGALIKDDKSSLIANSELVGQVNDDNGGIINFAHDFHSEELNAQTFIGQGVANRTHYGYTANLLTSLEHNGFKVSYKVDHLGRKLTTTIGDDASPMVSVVYNDNYVYAGTNIGRMVTETFKDNSSYVFVYDKRDLLIKSTFYLVASGTPTSTKEYFYDAYGRLADTILNREDFESYTYHINGQVAGRTVYATYGFNESRAYDDHQRLITIDNSVFEHPVSLEYNEQNQLKKATADAISLSLDYDPLKRISKKTLKRNTGEVVTDTFEYLVKKDGPTALIKEHAKYIGGYKKDAFVYSYDKLGNIIRITSDESNTRYVYDELSRLIREDNKALSKTYLYRYDAGGNIVSRRQYAYTLDDEPGTLTGKNVFQYALSGHKDRLSATIIGGTVQNVTYDDMGRPTSYKGSTLVWNKRGTLTSYGATSFTYNSDGIRISKGSMAFTLDGTRILSQVLGANSLKPIYLVDNMVGFWYNTTRYLFSKNIQGDIVSLLNEDGTLVATYVYDAYGNHKVYGSNGQENTEASFVGNINPFRYRGYYYDVETKLYYLNSRYYDPEVGRFLSPDILSILDETMMEANGLNLYMYCGNNPVMRVDPMGEAWWNWLIIGLQALAGIVACLIPGGQALGITLLVGATIGAIGQLVAPAIGQAISGITSVLNGWGAFSTGLSLMGFGIPGIIAGVGLMVIGSFTMAFGTNEIVSAATGINYIKEWTGISDEAYGWTYFGLNLASSLGQLLGQHYMQLKTRLATFNRKTGELKQYRYFDGNGNKLYDVDFNHSGTMMFPHYHAWLDNLTRIDDGHHGYIRLIIDLFRRLFGG